jgi:DNA-directed RNA polymerase specialized sigma24 family protein
MTTAAPTTCPDEDEIKIGLLGDEQEREDALKALWKYFSPRLMSFIVKKLPGLPLDLATNAVSDAFRDLAKRVLAGTFDFDPPIGRFLFTAAHRQAVDELRKYGRRPAGKADFYGTIGEYLKETEVGGEWQHLVAAAKAAAVSEAFRELLPSLPPIQRQVAQVVADFLPDELSREEICTEIHRRTGTRPTGIQVKSALGEVRRKFRELLKRICGGNAS